jgi:hypothetical protein
MAVGMRRGAVLTRRTLIKTASASAAITALGGIARRSLSLAPDRVQITHGVQSGDVSADSGVVWARADRPSRMLVEVATTDSFRDIKSAVFVDALPESDFTAKALIENLPPGQDIFYRISFQELSSAVFGEPQVGRFRTAPSDRRSHHGARLGHRRGARRHAHLCRHARQRARLLHSLRRQHLRRLPDRGGKETARRRRLAQHRHRGEIEAGGNAHRLSRQLQI